MLLFDNKKGILAEDTQATRNRIADQWIDALLEEGKPLLNTRPETPAGQLIDAQTALVAEKDNEILAIAAALNPETSEGIWLDALVKWFGIRRMDARPSIVTCLCRGTNGTVIPRGSIVSTKDGTKLVSPRAGTIGDLGVVEIDFYALEMGPIEFMPGTVNAIVTVIPGWDTVINPQRARLGSFRETDSALATRRDRLVALNARGSVAALTAALWAVIPPELAANGRDVSNNFVKIQDNDNSYPVPWRVSEQGDQTVPELIIPPHTTCIVMKGGADADIAEAIYKNKSSGSGTYGNHRVYYKDPEFYGVTYTYEIVRPEPIFIDIEVIATVINIGDLDLAGAAIALAWDFNWELILSGYFFCPLQKAGIQSLLDVKIKSPRDFDDWVDIIRIPGLYYPEIGRVTLVSGR